MGCPDPVRYKAGCGPPSPTPPGPARPLRAAAVRPPRATSPTPRAHRESSPPSRCPARTGPRPAAASRDVALSSEGASGTPLRPAVNFRSRGWGGESKWPDRGGGARLRPAVGVLRAGGGAGTTDARPVLVACPPRAAVGHWLCRDSSAHRRNGRSYRLCPSEGRAAHGPCALLPTRASASARSPARARLPRPPADPLSARGASRNPGRTPRPEQRRRSHCPVQGRLRPRADDHQG